MRDDNNPTMPPPRVVALLQFRGGARARLRAAVARNGPAVLLARESARQRALAAQVTPRGDHAPAAEVIEALSTIHIGDDEPGPNGGTQRIISRTNSAAFDETARRIARKKARAEKIAALRASGDADSPSPNPSLDHTRPNVALGKVLFTTLREDAANGRRRILSPIGEASVDLYIAEQKRMGAIDNDGNAVEARAGRVAQKVEPSPHK